MAMATALPTYSPVREYSSAANQIIPAIASRTYDSQTIEGSMTSTVPTARLVTIPVRGTVLCSDHVLRSGSAAKGPAFSGLPASSGLYVEELRMRTTEKSLREVTVKSALEE